MKLICSWFVSFDVECIVRCLVLVVCSSSWCVLLSSILFVLVSVIVLLVCENSCMLSVFLNLWMLKFSVGCEMNRCFVVCLKCSFLVIVMK